MLTDYIIFPGHSSIQVVVGTTVQSCSSDNICWISRSRVLGLSFGVIPLFPGLGASQNSYLAAPRCLPDRRGSSVRRALESLCFPGWLLCEAWLGESVTEETGAADCRVQMLVQSEPLDPKGARLSHKTACSRRSGKLSLWKSEPVFSTQDLLGWYVFSRTFQNVI